ncbi:hypothetical protein N0V86_003607 [Didymella sp. IMI 355093]|nr:hypothetical protein N0V86_003607 [Didymella sp. IMI 355093]
MGEMQRLLPATLSSNGEPAPAESNQSASPALSDKTVTAPPVGSNGDAKPQSQPGQQSAIFSTDLGHRAPRGLQQPGDFQPIARSDLVKDVIVGAGHLLRKYPYQYLNIFPQQGWQIGDLWDDYDIQVEGESYFTELLGFIERDNVIRVQKYASEYAQKHPERLHLIGDDIAGLYNKANPLSIVNKIFVNGESQNFPPSFLWKVAHFLRINMFAVKAMTEPSQDPASAPARSVTDHGDSVVHSTVHTPAFIEASASVPVATSNAVKASTPVVKSAPTMPNTQAAHVWHQELHFSHVPAGAPSHSRFGSPAAPVGGLGYTEPMGHMMPAGGPNMAQAGVYVPRTRTGRSASGSHSQIRQSNPYVENMPHIPSGFDAQQHPGPMSATQSPRFHPAPMAMNHPMSNVPPNMVPFGYGQGPVGLGAIAGQPHLTGAIHPSTMPPHAMQGPPMMQVYPRQPSNAQGLPFAVPMGDMTNVRYGGPPRMPMQNMDSRRPSERRFSQQHPNCNALYDPSMGNDLAFKDMGYPNGKTYNQNSMNISNGRQRKPSFPGSRPYQGQYTNGRPQTGGSYNTRPKSHLDNNIAITQDQEYGCYIDWIGPKNESVNELFVKDLPEDIREAELENIFQERLGVRLTSVNIGSRSSLPQYSQSRKHAFVGFPDCAIAKQALLMSNPTIRGQRVSITVPRRFFKKTLDAPSRDIVEAGPSAYSRYTSNPNNLEVRDRALSIEGGSDVTSSTTATKEKPSYSPQDARSDLPKKKGKQTQQAQATAGSPEARKTKTKKQRQELPTKEEPATSREAVKTDELNRSAGLTPALTTVEATTSTISEQTAQPQASKATPSTAAEEDVVKTISTEAVVLVSHANDSVSNTAPSEPPPVVPALPVATTVEQAATCPPQQKTTTATQTPTTTSTSLEALDPASDDELKNDASFHSAAESQSELEAKGIPQAGSDLANHRTTPQGSEASTATIISTPAPSAPTTNIIEEVTNATIADAVVPTTAEKEQFKQESKATVMPPATSEAAGVPAAAQQEIETATTSTLAGQIKKSGLQQPERFFVGQKQLKAQAKRDKEQKKKAQKKEKELAQKKKAEKSAADKLAAKEASAEDATAIDANEAVDKTDVHDDGAKPLADVESVVTTATTPGTTQAVKQTNATRKKSASTETTQKTAENSSGKPGKGKGRKADTLDAKATTTEDKGEDHGKQTNGSSATLESGSMTNKGAKAESPENVQETLTKEATQESVPATDVQSSKPDDSRETTSCALGSDLAGPGPEGLTLAGKKKNKKKKKKNATVAKGEAEAPKTTLVWPDLEFRSKSPNPAWMGPIDMETDTQNYEKIMNEACGGPDDSDYSWSDLPTMEHVLSSDQPEVVVTQALQLDRKATAGVGREETVSRGIAALEAQICKNSLKPLISRSLTSIGAKKEEMEPVDATIVAYDKQLAELTGTQRTSSADEGRTAYSHAQLTATTAETAASKANIAAGEDPYDTGSPDAQPVKRKKANKHKNKKKRKPTENGEALQSGDTVEPTGTASAPPKAAAGPIDPMDPFLGQLKHIDAVIDLNQSEAAASSTASIRGGAATPTDEPTLMRTMEAYFREAHPERRGKGRKVSQRDLQ